MNREQKDATWDKLQEAHDKLQELLVTIAPVAENESIRKEIIAARSYVIRAQALT